MFPFLEVSQRAFSSFRHFVRSVLPLNSATEPVHLKLSTERRLNAETRNANSTLVSGVGVPESRNGPELEQVAGFDDTSAEADTPGAPLSPDDFYNSVQPIEVDYNLSSSRGASVSLRRNAMHITPHLCSFQPHTKTADDAVLNPLKPVPSSRLRVRSHPNIQALCREWADNNEVMGTSTIYRLVSASDSK
jgi:hypothetical protein